jgi:hypothetical protein
MTHFAQRQHQRQFEDTDDLVATFVENELGRHDWMNNWAAWKVKYPNYLDKIRSFFERQGEQVNPEDVCKHIDQMILVRPGRWR